MILHYTPCLGSKFNVYNCILYITTSYFKTEVRQTVSKIIWHTELDKHQNGRQCNFALKLRQTAVTLRSIRCLDFCCYCLFAIAVFSHRQAFESEHKCFTNLIPGAVPQRSLKLYDAVLLPPPPPPLLLLFSCAFAQTGDSQQKAAALVKPRPRRVGSQSASDFLDLIVLMKRDIQSQSFCCL